MSIIKLIRNIIYTLLSKIKPTKVNYKMYQNIKRWSNSYCIKIWQEIQNILL